MAHLPHNEDGTRVKMNKVLGHIYSTLGTVNHDYALLAFTELIDIAKTEGRAQFSLSRRDILELTRSIHDAENDRLTEFEKLAEQVFRSPWCSTDISSPDTKTRSLAPKVVDVDDEGEELLITVFRVPCCVCRATIDVGARGVHVILTTPHCLKTLRKKYHTFPNDATGCVSDTWVDYGVSEVNTGSETKLNDESHTKTYSHGADTKEKQIAIGAGRVSTVWAGILCALAITSGTLKLLGYLAGTGAAADRKINSAIAVLEFVLQLELWSCMIVLWRYLYRTVARDLARACRRSTAVVPSSNSICPPNPTSDAEPKLILGKTDGHGSCDSGSKESTADHNGADASVPQSPMKHALDQCRDDGRDIASLTGDATIESRQFIQMNGNPATDDNGS
ncbi:hypothetical protein LTR17_015391 [Elasticomyces elasticus]|nr:hypothetical protein LTR17_015391 [Elasticomyces elasticus]